MCVGGSSTTLTSAPPVPSGFCSVVSPPTAGRPSSNVRKALAAARPAFFASSPAAVLSTLGDDVAAVAPVASVSGAGGCRREGEPSNVPAGAEAASVGDATVAAPETAAPDDAGANTWPNKLFNEDTGCAPGAAATAGATGGGRSAVAADEGCSVLAVAPRLAKWPAPRSADGLAVRGGPKLNPLAGGSPFFDDGV